MIEEERSSTNVTGVRALLPRLRETRAEIPQGLRDAVTSEKRGGGGRLAGVKIEFAGLARGILRIVVRGTGVFISDI